MTKYTASCKLRHIGGWHEVSVSSESFDSARCYLVEACKAIARYGNVPTPNVAEKQEEIYFAIDGLTVSQELRHV